MYVMVQYSIYLHMVCEQIVNRMYNPHKCINECIKRNILYGYTYYEIINRTAVRIANMYIMVTIYPYTILIVKTRNIFVTELLRKCYAHKSILRGHTEAIEKHYLYHVPVFSKKWMAKNRPYITMSDTVTSIYKVGPVRGNGNGNGKQKSRE